MRELRPSAANAWSACPSYEGDTGGNTVYAEEGIQAHGVVESILKTGTKPTEAAADMEAHALAFIEYAKPFVPDGYSSECRVSGLVLSGTVDLWGYDKSKGTLHVFDYKYGFNPVEAVDNMQLLCYAAMLCESRGLAPVRVCLHIYQPRAYHYAGPGRVWELTLAEFSTQTAKLKAHIAAAQEATTTRVGSHCKRCARRGQCETLSREVAACFEYYESTRMDPTDPAEIAFNLALAEVVQEIVAARVDALTAQATQILSNGGTVPGYGFKSGRGSVSWQDPAEALKLADTLGVDIRQPAKPITPKQAERLLPHALINQITIKTPGAQKLARINPAEIRHIFGGL